MTLQEIASLSAKNEVKQAQLRSISLGLAVIYAAILGIPHLNITIITLLLALLTIPLSVHLYQQNHISNWQTPYRTGSLVFDFINSGFCFYSLGIYSFPFYFVYIWINIDNATRYGFRYSILTSILTVITLSTIFVYSDWTSSAMLFPFIAIGVIVTCIPIYFGFLTLEREKRVETLKHHSSELEYLIHHDELTQIYNRKAFNQYFNYYLERAKQTNESFALLLLDIDFFKKYNDEYGHLQGDVCLKSFAQLLSACFNQPNNIVARYGGEEFVVLIKDTVNCDMKTQQFHNLLQHQAIPHIKNQYYGIVTTSIGGVIVEKNLAQEKNPAEIIEYADQALYKAKKQGRNQTKWHYQKDFSHFKPSEELASLSLEH